MIDICDEIYIHNFKNFVDYVKNAINPDFVDIYNEISEELDKNGIYLVDRTEAQIHGVVTAVRRMGKLAFAKLLTTDGSIQLIIRQNELGDAFKGIIGSLALGTHVLVEGIGASSKTREVSFLVRAIDIVQEARMPFPDKWNGVSEEEKRRLRYQDCLVDRNKHDVLIKRSQFISAVRTYLSQKGFLEVETPIFHKVSAGAQARSFTVESNATGDEYHLRIAPETYLKRMTAAGYHKIFEIGKQFRNEGIDSSHMPEFTSCEWYEAYTSAEDQIGRFIGLLQHLEYSGFSLGFDIKQIRTLSFKHLYNDYCPVGLDETPIDQIDANFKQYVRPTLNNPYFIIDYPEHVAPLAKRNPNKPGYVEMWQFVWKQQEVVKCYTELTDPVKQRKLLEGQLEARNGGDSEAMMLDEAFLQTMEFGMPPQAGVGIGIDRLFSLFMGIEDIRDCVFFPLGV